MKILNYKKARELWRATISYTYDARSKAPAYIESTRLWIMSSWIHCRDMYSTHFLVDVAQIKPDKIRQERFRVLKNKFLAFVIIPTLSATFYYTFLAEHWYVTETKFLVQTPGQKSSGFLENALGAGMSPSAKNTLRVNEYITSIQAMLKLQDEANFFDIFQSKDIRFFSRMSQNEDLEYKYDYYLDQISITFDNMGDISTLRVKAPNSKSAVFIAKKLLHISEQVVNHLSERQQQDKVKFAETQVRAEEENLLKARQNLLNIQNNFAEIDPASSAKSLYGIKGSLESEIAGVQTQILEKKSYLREDSYQMKSLENKLKSLEYQVTKEKNILSAQDTYGVSKKLDLFSAAQIRKEIAEKSYIVALQFLANARNDALQQSQYLVVLAEPFEMDTWTEPNIPLITLTFFLSLAVLMFVLSTIITMTREHLRM